MGRNLNTFRIIFYNSIKKQLKLNLFAIARMIIYIHYSCYYCNDIYFILLMNFIKRFQCCSVLEIGKM